MTRVLVFLLAGLTGAAAAFSQEPPPRHAPRELADAERAPTEERANAAWSKLSLREKRQLLRLQRALQEMPAAERRFVHERIERFLNMSPEDRARLHKNRERWEQMSPEQRERAREEFRRRRAEFEERWRREHPDGEPPPPWPPRHRQGPHPPPPQPPPPKENP